MKIFAYFVLGFMLVALGGLFFNTGISARNDKYIKEIVLAEKGENTLENNRDPLFVERMFSLNNLMYNKTTVGTITYTNTVTIENTEVDLNITIDLYQTMPLMFDDGIRHYFHGVVSEFKSSLEDEPYLTIIGYYERDIKVGNNSVLYRVNNPNFPVFGLNHTITSSEVNKLNSAVFTYRDIKLFEIVLNESQNLETKYYLADFENYPTDLNHFYNTVNETLTVRSGGYQMPDEAQLQILNDNNYNFHIFKGQEQYNYLIWVYMGIYLVIVGVVLYFAVIRKRIKKNA